MKTYIGSRRNYLYSMNLYSTSLVKTSKAEIVYIFDADYQATTQSSYRGILSEVIPRSKSTSIRG